MRSKHFLAACGGIALLTLLCACPAPVDLAPVSHTVSFESQGGSAVSAQTVTTGQLAVEPAAPTRNGYVFVAWYKEAACMTAWDFARDTVAAETTLYAKWKLGTWVSAMIGNLMPVDGGSFNNGSATVTLSSFWMARYELPQAQYLAVSGAALPSGATGTTSDCPIDGTSWFDAVEFCNQLSAADGLEAVYVISGRTPTSGHPISAATVTMDMSKNGYRLPTEAEWEFAARGGIKSQGYTYAGSNTPGDVAWTQENSDTVTRPVGTKAPNELGLYDLSGNIYEWCWDWYGTLSSSPQTNPVGPDSGSFRITRGGAHSFSASSATVNYRYWWYPDSMYGNMGGIRVVKR